MEYSHRVGELSNRNQIKAAALERERRLTAYIKIDLTAMPQPSATCLVCRDLIRVPNSDQFIPYTVWVENKEGKHYTKMLKTNKEALKWFQEKHWHSCIRFFDESKGGDVSMIK